MPATYSHSSIAPGATLTAATWNADHDNHIDSRSAETLEGSGGTVDELQATFEVGDVGSETLPRTVEEEIQALRDQILHIKNTAQWYTSNVATGYGWAAPMHAHTTAAVVQGLSSSGTTSYWWNWRIPPDYVSGDITLRFYMTSRGASGGVADLRAAISVYVTEGDLSNQTAGNTEVIFTGDFTFPSASVPAVGTLIAGYLSRYGDDASDTNTGIIQLIAIRFSYLARAGGAKR